MPPPNITDRITTELSRYFPSRTNYAQSVSVQLDGTPTPVAFDADGLANDSAGTAYFIVRRDVGCYGWVWDCPSMETSYLVRRFSYFIKDNGDLILRELNPIQTLHPTAGLTAVPPVPGGGMRGGGIAYRPANAQDAQNYVASLRAANPIAVFVNNFDPAPGNEIGIFRGATMLGAVNILAGLFAPPSP